MKQIVLKNSILFIIVTLLWSIQLQAQTFDNNSGAGDGNWNTATNWNPEALPGISDVVTLTASPILNVDSTIDKIVSSGGSVINLIGANKLTLDGTANPIIHANSNSAFTIDCEVEINSASQRRIDLKNNASSQLVFGTSSILELSSAVQLRNFNITNSMLFNGALQGSGNLTYSSNGIITNIATFSSTADNSGYSGTMTTFEKEITSNIASPNLFLSSNATFQFNNTAGGLILNGENSVEGTISRTGSNIGISIVSINANQNNIGTLNLNASDPDVILQLDVNATVTDIVFNNTGSIWGATLDIVGFNSGVINFGTSLSTTQLDAITLNGLVQTAGTITQDSNGYLTRSDTTTNPGDWELASNWVSGVVPESNEIVTIDHQMTIDSDVITSDMTINSSGRVTVNPGKSLTIDGDVTTSNDIFLDSNSTTYSSLIVSGTITGQITYERYTSAFPTNDLIASPVTPTFGNFATAGINSALYDNPSNTTEKLFGPFNNDSSSYVHYDEVGDASTSLVLGKGYRAARDTGGTLRFKATGASTSNVTIAITDEVGVFGKWNLIGNPYPCYLDFGEFFTENSSQFDSGVYQAIYGYDGDASDGWVIWNNLNASNKIAPAQGFFVRTKSGGGTVTFKPAMRAIGSSDDFIMGRNTPNNLLSQLNLNNSTDTYSTKIYFVENQTRGLDPGYDAGAYGGNASGIFTHLVEDNIGEEIALQALPFDDFNDVIVPLGVRVSANELISIGINSESNLNSNINVYLIDTELNSTTLLNEGSYEFTPSVNLDDVGRFFVRYSTETLTVNDANGWGSLSIYATANPKLLTINGQLDYSTTVNLYDISGRLVLSKKLKEKDNSNTIDISGIAFGIYIVKLSNTNGQLLTKKIIIK